MKKSFVVVFLSVLSTACFATGLKWQTHFSYNKVEQIALYEDEVYALANGKLFSINQETEQLTLYNNKSGVHGMEIVQLMTDTLHNQLLIMYMDGKMDILCGGVFHYVSDLYNKKMTSSKICNNITIVGELAYLSMDFGILTFDLNKYEFKNTYYIGPEASDVKVLDVILEGDSIYAKTAEGIYSAAIQDNIVDFRYWHITKDTMVVFDTQKTKEYQSEEGNVWKVAGEKGVLCRYVTGIEQYYLPAGPCVNMPYQMTFAHGRLYVVPGGKWAVQESNPGSVMIYEQGSWVNIANAAIQKQTGKKALDFVNVAVDADDASHFFVTSYGTGLYEFSGDSLVNHYTPDNSILGSAVPSSPDLYTRLDNAVFDDAGRLWTMVAGNVEKTLVAFLPDQTQQGINLYPNDTRLPIFTPTGLLVDNRNANRKWILYGRYMTSLILLDDGGTPFDESDDRCKQQTEFYDQDANVIVPEFLYGMSQAPNGDLWIGSTVGPIIIPNEIDFFDSKECRRLRIEMPDGSNLLDLEPVNDFEWDDDGYVWIATQTAGVYVVDVEKQEIVHCYASDNTVMPSNTVLSLAYDSYTGTMYLGTDLGIVSVQLSEGAQTPTNRPNDEELVYGNMYQWRSHAAFTSMDELAVMGDDVYTRSGQALFSINKKTELIDYHNRLTGLNGAQIQHVARNGVLDKLLVTYQDGQLDIIDASGDVQNISDLYLKQMSASKEVNNICMYQDKAYLAMKFGILVLDMRKLEVEDTYYIGQNSTEINIEYLSIGEEKIYAATQSGLYVANLTDNLLDYNVWHKHSLPGEKTLMGMCWHNNMLYLVRGGVLYVLHDGQWKTCTLDKSLRGLCKTENHLYLLPENAHGVLEVVNELEIADSHTFGYVNDVVEDGDVLWFATSDEGVVKLVNNQHNSYFPDGPNSNFSYRLKFYGDKLYMLPGGRWATQYNRLGEIMIYEDGEWKNVKNADLVATANHAIYDVMNVAQDPQDSQHYFVTTYGTGMLEMYGDSLVQLHLPNNSSLKSVVPSNPDFYTRTDAAMYDEQGNLWVMNMGISNGNIHVVEPNGKWNSFDLIHNGSILTLHTVGEIMVDRRNTQWKWIPVLRYNTGLVLLQDNGTPTNPSDDKVYYRNEWLDQNNHLIAPEFIYCMAQDQNNTIWVGTSKGLFILRDRVDFASSNACERIVMPRNDGTGLGDYLLENEQINAIMIDGANRIWIGTASSGVYLMGFTEDTEDADYTLETIAHFTTDNSLLPSDNILSIAIQESTGEVFFGTGAGLVSYMSDAIEPEEDFSNLYVYPNPVRPNYRGNVVIKGLMANTDVRIVDAAGNVIKTLKGTGGEVIWDMSNMLGQRVASGVYTILCNTTDGLGADTVKVLIMN